MMMAADGWYIYNGQGAVPDDATRVRIDESVTVIPAEAFYGNRSIEEVDCHDRVKTVKEYAFFNCPSLTRAIMPGVKFAEKHAFIYTGGEAVIPRHVTRVRIDESLTVIPAYAFRGNPSIEEVECHDRVKTVKEYAFFNCPSLTRAIMRGVRVVERLAFYNCEALMKVECGKLEIIGYGAFFGCESLTSINLPSVKIVEGGAFSNCTALTNVKFGKKLESIEYGAFFDCTSLERITIPLKDGMITQNNTFQGCKKLKHVDLVKGALHETIAALLLEEWKSDMNREINAINQIIPTAHAGDDYGDDYAGGKAQAVRMWMGAVLGKIIHYKAEHQSFLNEAATTLQHVLPNDIVIKSVLPFLELPNMNMQP